MSTAEVMPTEAIVSEVLANVTIDTAALKAALAKFAGVVPTKSVRPQLNDSIVIMVNHDRLILSAHNLEQFLRVRIPATVTRFDQQWVYTDFKALKLAVSAIKTPQTDLTFTDKTITIAGYPATAIARVNIKGSAADYPIFPREIPPEAHGEYHRTLAEFAMPAGEFAKALRVVLPGVARGGARYAIDCVCMAKTANGGVELCTSNTHVLYVNEIPLATCPVDLPTQDDDVLFPLPAVEWLSKNLPITGDVVMRFTKHEIYLSCDNEKWKFGIGRPSGRFPRYRDVVPEMKNRVGQLTVDRKEMLAALSQLKSHTCSESKRFDIVPEENGERVGLHAEIEGVTTFTATIPAASRKCAPMQFNVCFLLDALAVMTSDLVTFRFAKTKPDENPVVIQDSTLTFVIMPMNRDKKTESFTKMVQPILDRYAARINEPDQDFPGAAAPLAPVAKKAAKAPAIKTIVTHAKADPAYLAALLSALGIEPAASVA